MHDNPTTGKNAVDQFLDVPIPGAVDDELRQRVLHLSTRVLRRRLHLKRCGHAAVLLLCYVAGLATMRLLPPAAWPMMAQGVARRAAEQPPQNKNAGAASELAESRHPAESLESDP